MLPSTCSIVKHGKHCLNPPHFVISVSTDSDEYMIGIVCQTHQTIIESKLKKLQENNKIPQGAIHFEPIKSVGTACIRLEPDVIQID